MVVDAYARITHDYTLTAARAFQKLGSREEPFTFVYISGEGADQSERSWTLFGKIKGRTEKALADMSSESFKTVSLRPGAILMTEEVCASNLITKVTQSASQSIEHLVTMRDHGQWMAGQNILA